MKLFKTIVFLAGFLAGPALAQHDAELFFTNIEELPAPGETFEVGLYVNDGNFSVASYALRLVFNASVVNVLEIKGGKDAIYAADPVSNAGSYAKGVTDFTAVKAGHGETPETFQIARIRFIVVGEADSAGFVALRPSPNGGLVDAKHYSLLRAKMPRQLRTRIGRRR